jgi:spore maturation protein CgeB
MWVTSIANGVTAFYDIDTPVTLAKLARGDYEYLSPELIPLFDVYLSFTGGPTLRLLEQKYGSPAARALYCSFDPDLYYPIECSIFSPQIYCVGYLGTYSIDRQPTLEQFLIEPARQFKDDRFVVAGPQYPKEIDWPDNVHRIEHCPPAEHRTFYCSQKFTLNVTRADMIKAGYSPSVRLFEAAACGVPIISDYWDGIETIFTPDREIFIARSTDDVLRILRDVKDEQRQSVGSHARQRVLASHTAAHRAQELESYILEAKSRAKVTR